ncbi:MAG: heavy metal translocating P-type ATPase [Alphaproteobacteria bacterium]|nr:heavy metal translocating P-type ATPase [Alphaproteobacteria bacterium]
MAALTAPFPAAGADQSADPSVFVRRDGKGGARLELAVKGARCANCIAKIESGLKTMEGVTDARLNLSTGKLAVTWRDAALPPDAIVKRVIDLGYDARPYDPEAQLRNEDEDGRFLLRCMAVAGFATANVMLLSISIWAGAGDMGDATRTLFHWISGLIAIPAAFYAGRPFFRSALKSLIARHANMDVPISLAIMLALGLSIYQTAAHGENAYFDAAVALPFLLLIGRYLDHMLRRRARSAARDLVAMQAVVATRLDQDGHAHPVMARDIAVGDLIQLATGERAPVDGTIEDFDTEADVSLVTGESAPVPVTRGSLLRAGSIVTGRGVLLRAAARVEDSLVAELARVVEAGQQNRSSYVRLADRAASVYVPAVHGLALTVLVGWLITGASVPVALTNAIALLIITCPCALGLAVPAVQIVATGLLFRRGVLVKSGDALERLAEIDRAVFDKTGTLTIGRPVLRMDEVLDPAVLAAAARLARASRHPLARALCVAAGIGPVADGAHEVPGFGVEASEGAVTRRLGRADWVGAAQGDGASSELWFRDGEAAPVRFAFDDPLRPDAGPALKAIAARGIECEMLSGDHARAAGRVAGEAGVVQWRAGVDPKEKAGYLEALAREGRRALMVGDGLNDAAALALAHVSISPGTAVDATQAAADMVLQGDTLWPIVEAVDVSRQARRRVLENFAFAAAYNAIAVPLAAAGLVTPLIAALAMASSSLIVTLNALRLRARA